ncbi:MAG TPA: hypothetical protein VIV58_08435, partial [Kofleriaceae bacterium]
MAAARKPKKKQSTAKPKKASAQNKTARAKAAKPKIAAKSKSAAKKPATKAKATVKAKAAPAKSKPKTKPTTKAVELSPELDAVPRIIDDDELFSNSGRRKTARDWSARSSPVVEILDDPHPVGALRRFLDSIKGPATEQQSEIALGAAQLLLLPIAREARGGGEVKELLDLVLERWADFRERRFGFHAQEFLRNAFAAVGVDRERIVRLEAAVPVGASSELLFEVACAYAVARDKVAMLRAVEEALAAGASPSPFRREQAFAPSVADPSLAVILARADIPAIPVDVDPYRA